MGPIGAIGSLSSGTYSVTRHMPGGWTNGDYTPGSTSVFPVVASEQPLSGRDLQILPEGQHANDVRKLYTTDEIVTRSPGSISPDQVEIDNEPYEVFRVSTWKAFGGVHYVVYASRLVVTP